MSLVVEEKSQLLMVWARHRIDTSEISRFLLFIFSADIEG